MGGFASIRFTRSSASPPNQFVTLMCPVTCISDELPVRTFTLPDPVLRSRLTGPVTGSVRWKEPSDEAAAGNPAAAVRSNRNTSDRLVERSQTNRYEFDLINRFLPFVVIHIATNLPAPSRLQVAPDTS